MIDTRPTLIPRCKCGSGSISVAPSGAPFCRVCGDYAPAGIPAGDVLAPAPSSVTAAERAMVDVVGSKLSTPDKFKVDGRRFAGAFGLESRDTCDVGDILAGIDGTPCKGCYGDKRGRYGCGNVIDCQTRRRATLDVAMDAGEDSPEWRAVLEAFAGVITAHGYQYFRWHDTGDTYRREYVALVLALAYRLPRVAFWLPTQEHEAWRALAHAGAVPTNLVVRYSARALNYFTSDDAGAFADLARELAAAGVELDAPAAGEAWSCVDTTGARHVAGAVVCGCGRRGNCGRCRACWNAGVPIVIYPYHGPRAK